MCEMNELQSRIEAVVLNNNGIIFGGYLRDKIAGKEPSDMDVQCSSYDRRRILTQLLEKFGEIHVQVQDMKEKGYQYNGNFAFSHWAVTVQGFTVDLIVLNHEKLVKKLDFDVNSLKLVRINQRDEMTTFSGLPFMRILDNIRNNRAEQMSNVPEHRIEKMQAKGWDIVKSLLD